MYAFSLFLKNIKKDILLEHLMQNNVHKQNTKF